MNEYYTTYSRPKKHRRGFVMWLLDITLTLLSPIVFLMMVFTLLVPYLNPSSTWSFPVLGLLAPVTYILSLVLTLYWVIRWRWGRASLLLLVSVFGFFKIPLFFCPESSKDFVQKIDKKIIISVMSYNVRSFYDDKGQSSVDKWLDFIMEQDPDIVCLQEYNVGLAEQNPKMEEMKNRYDMAFFRDENCQDSMCMVPMCVWSKFRVLKKGVIGSPRNAVWVDLKVGRSDTMRVFNNHLLSTKIKAADGEYITSQRFLQDTAREAKMRSILGRFSDNSVLRAVQVDTISQVIAQTRTRHIVLGDFNDTPMSYSYRKMAKGLKDAFSEKGSGYSATFRGFLRMLRIDYMLYSKGLEALSYEVPEVDFSDHYPVLVQFRKTEMNH